MAQLIDTEYPDRELTKEEYLNMFRTSPKEREMAEKAEKIIMHSWVKDGDWNIRMEFISKV